VSVLAKLEGLAGQSSQPSTSLPDVINKSKQDKIVIFGLTSKDPLPVTKPERIVALKALVMTQPLKIKPDYDASAIKKLIKQIFIVLKRNESEGDSSVNIVGGDEES
jgi:hypothetical protein